VRALAVARMEPNHWRKRAPVKSLVIVRGVEQLAVQIAIDHAHREPADLSGMRAQHLTMRLLRQELRNDDERREQGGRDQGRYKEDRDAQPRLIALHRSVRQAAATRKLCSFKILLLTRCNALVHACRRP
jgi:hypothetical protein